MQDYLLRRGIVLPDGAPAAGSQVRLVKILGCRLTLTAASATETTLAAEGTPAGGYWRLKYDGTATEPLALGDDAATIEAALEAIEAIGIGQVSVSGGPLPGSDVTITFTGDADTAKLQVQWGQLTGGALDEDSETIPAATILASGEAEYAVTEYRPASPAWVGGRWGMGLKYGGDKWALLPGEYPLPDTATANIAPFASGSIGWGLYSQYGSLSTDATNIGTLPIYTGDLITGYPHLGRWRLQSLMPATRIVITQAAISANSSGNCKFTTGSPGSEVVTGSNVTMHWRTGTGETIPTSTKCFADLINDGVSSYWWSLTPQDCL